jgi:mRNA interferase RelE/StbE
MSNYTIVFTDSAVGDIERLDAVVKKRIAKKLKYFVGLEDPLSKAEKLVSSKIGSYRWRIGDYRVVFDINKYTIVVLRVRHRREAYRSY